MKNYILIFILLIISNISAYVQKNQLGIFKTFDDYKNQKITYQSNCIDGKKSIRISNFFLRPHIFIKTENSTLKVLQDSIYAIKDCENQIFRI
jgi:hypothetical protein